MLSKIFRKFSWLVGLAMCEAAVTSEGCTGQVNDILEQVNMSDFDWTQFLS